MPPSRLDGRQPLEVTEYEYDETSGRLLRSVTTRESEWTELDTAEMFALSEYRQMLCPCGCGFLAADSLSHEETGPKFETSRNLCRARLELVEQQRTFANTFGDKGDEKAEARLWQITKRKK